MTPVKTTLNYMRNFIQTFCTTYFLITETEKNFCYKKVPVIFSNHCLQLGIYYHRKHEKQYNLKQTSQPERIAHREILIINYEFAKEFSTVSPKIIVF